MPKNKIIYPSKKIISKLESSANKYKKILVENLILIHLKKNIIRLRRIQMKIQKNKLEEIYQMY